MSCVLPRRKRKHELVIDVKWLIRFHNAASWSTHRSTVVLLSWSNIVAKNEYLLCSITVKDVSYMATC